MSYHFALFEYPDIKEAGIGDVRGIFTGIGTVSSMSIAVPSCPGFPMPRGREPLGIVETAPDLR
jgi:hypothetical protein